MDAARRSAAGVVLLAGLALGCNGGRDAYVTNFPQWEFERYPRVAVLPGRANDPRAADVALLLSDRLTTLLSQTGAFTVLSRSELRDVLTEQDLSRLADTVGSGDAMPEGQVAIAQAFVAPNITDYRVSAEKETQAIPRYVRDRRGRVLRDRNGQPIVAGRDLVEIYRHTAEIEGSVRVVDVATGEILLSRTARIGPLAATNRGRPPSRSPEQLAADAVGELATAFFRELAPTRIRVKLDEDMLIVARGYFDGRYDEEEKLPPTLPEFLLVVRDLPPACERNEFRVAIAEEDGRRNLIEERFTWTGGLGPAGVSYSVATSRLLETGAKKFLAKLYSVGDPEPILERSFELDIEESSDGNDRARDVDRRDAGRRGRRDRDASENDREEDEAND